MLRLPVALLVLLACAPGPAFAEGRIAEIRREASEPPTPSLQGSKAKDSDSKKDDDDDFWSSFLSDMGIGEVIGPIFLSPFTAPRLLLQDKSEAEARFPKYPYPNRFPGYLWLDYCPFNVPDAQLQEEMKGARRWSLRIIKEDGNDFNGMNRAGIRATFETWTRWGMTTNWNYISESDGHRQYDSTWLGDTNVIYRFAQNEVAQFYTGLGFRTLTDSQVTKWGFNYVYGVDFFPKKPVIGSALFDVGTVGSATVLHARATIGANWRHFEAFTGYDFIRIGSVNVQGPMVGLRFWH